MEFSYSQTENFEMEKLSSDTGYFKKPVEINRGSNLLQVLRFLKNKSGIKNKLPLLLVLNTTAGSSLDHP